MKKVLFSFCFGLGILIQAQQYVHQVLVLNEGYYDYQTSTQGVPVTVGSYNPSTQYYQEVSTINGMRFASDLIIEGNFYYVAADAKILKFDLNNHALIAEVSCPGVRNLGISQGKLIATRGEYLTTFDSYLHVYDANSLQLIQAIDTVQGPKWATQNVVILGNTAYIAVNNGYEWGNEKGIIGALDLQTLSYGNEIDLGPDGKNPDNLFAFNGSLYTVNNKDWSGSSISKVNVLAGSVQTENIANAGTGCGTSALLNDQLIYQLSMATELEAYDLNVLSYSGPVNGHSLTYYELCQNPVNQELYTSETDFFSYGKVHIFDPSHQELSQFQVGVSPGTIVFDVRPLANINENNQTEALAFPNPAQGKFNLKGYENQWINLVSLDGKIVKTMQGSQLSSEGVNPGFYLLVCEDKRISTLMVK
jgi:hypothetical protein